MELHSNFVFVSWDFFWHCVSTQHLNDWLLMTLSILRLVSISFNEKNVTDFMIIHKIPKKTYFVSNGLILPEQTEFWFRFYSVPVDCWSVSFPKAHFWSSNFHSKRIFPSINLIRIRACIVTGASQFYDLENVLNEAMSENHFKGNEENEGKKNRE